MRKLVLSLSVLAAAGLFVTSVPAQADQVSSAPAALVAQASAKSERDSFLGTWRRTDVSESCAANLFFAQGDAPGELKVRLRSNNGGNEGFIEGKALMQGTDSYTAAMTFDDGKSKENVLGTMTFTMGQRGIEVKYDGDPKVLNLGVGVTVTGVYVKGNPNYIAAVDPLHCFRNTENFHAAIQLVGEKNMLNMRDVFKNGIVLVDIPGEYQGFVKGTGTALQVKTDIQGHIYILGRNLFPNAEKKQLVFFTNDKSMVNQIPVVFDFTGDEREVLVVYKDINPAPTGTNPSVHGTDPIIPESNPLNP